MNYDDPGTGYTFPTMKCFGRSLFFFF